VLHFVVILIQIDQLVDLCDADVVTVPIPMSTDNYCYLVIDEFDNTGVLIDAADPDAVQVKSRNSTHVQCYFLHTHTFNYNVL